MLLKDAEITLRDGTSFHATKVVVDVNTRSFMVWESRWFVIYPFESVFCIRVKRKEDQKGTIQKVCPECGNQVEPATSCHSGADLPNTWECVRCRRTWNTEDLKDGGP